MRFSVFDAIIININSETTFSRETHQKFIKIASGGVVMIMIIMIIMVNLLLKEKEESNWTPARARFSNPAGIHHEAPLGRLLHPLPCR